MVLRAIGSESPVESDFFQREEREFRDRNSLERAALIRRLTFQPSTALVDAVALTGSTWYMTVSASK